MNNSRIDAIMKQASQMKIFNKKYVVRPLIRETTIKNPITSKWGYVEQPCFGAYQQCLCGILKNGETLEQFRVKWILQKRGYVTKNYKRKRKG